MRFFFVLLVALPLSAQVAHAQAHAAPATTTPAAPPPAQSAGPEAQVEQLRAMMLDANFSEALTQARAILARTDVSAALRNATLESLATAQLATRDQRGARETLALLYSRDPDHRMLDREASPTVVAAFDRARESHPTPAPVTIESASPAALTARAAPVLQVRLTAGADTVNELRLSYRQGDATDYQRVLMEHAASLATATARIPVLEGDAEYTLDWYVEGLAPSQVIVGRLGDATTPLHLSVPRGLPRVTAESLAVTQRAPRDEAEPSGGGSVFGTWWFWTVVGVVIVGGAASAYVLTLPADQTPCGTLGCGSL